MGGATINGQAFPLWELFNRATYAIDYYCNAAPAYIDRPPPGRHRWSPPTLDPFVSVWVDPSDTHVLAATPIGLAASTHPYTTWKAPTDDDRHSPHRTYGRCRTRS